VTVDSDRHVKQFLFSKKSVVKGKTDFFEKKFKFFYQKPFSLNS